MPSRKRDDDDDRSDRIAMILEELRLNTEDLHELARQARERAATSRRDVRVMVSQARERQARIRAKKR